MASCFADPLVDVMLELGLSALVDHGILNCVLRPRGFPACDVPLCPCEPGELETDHDRFVVSSCAKLPSLSELAAGGAALNSSQPGNAHSIVINA